MSDEPPSVGDFYIPQTLVASDQAPEALPVKTKAQSQPGSSPTFNESSYAVKSLPVNPEMVPHAHSEAAWHHDKKGLEE